MIRKALFSVVAFLSVSALNPCFALPGRLDTTFGAAGIAITQFGRGTDTAGASHLDAQGRLVVAGVSTIDSNSTGVGIVRVLADGSLDPAFGVSGKALVKGPLRVISVTGVVRLADGRYAVSGYGDSANSRVAFVARFLANGSLDPSFGTQSGFTTFVTPGGFSTGTSAGRLALQADGRLLVATIQQRVMVTRLLADGALDASFGAGTGSVSPFDAYAIDEFSGRFDVAQLPDGKLLVMAALFQNGGTTARAARLHVDGSKDQAYGVLGDATFVHSEGLGNARFAVTAQGEVLVASFSLNYRGGMEGADLQLMRFTAGGTVDVAFGVGAGSNTGAPRFAASAIGATPQVLGFGNLSATPLRIAVGLPAPQFGSVAYGPGGLPDPAVGNGSGILLTSTLASGCPQGPHIQDASGRWTGIGPSFTTPIDFKTCRFLATAASDDTWGPLGRRDFDVGNSAFPSEARALVASPDGKIIAVGTAAGAGVIDNVAVVARYRLDGSLDTDFAGRGFLVDGFGSATAAANGVALDAQGRIVVVGSVAGRAVVARYLANGAPDTTFGTGGITTASLLGESHQGNAIAIAPDGKIVIAGVRNADSRSFAGRFLPDGTPDESFGFFGAAMAVPGVLESSVAAVHALADGSVLVGGSIMTSGQRGMFASKLTANGAFDNAFGSGGIFQRNDTFGDGRSMAVQSDGRILLGGLTSTAAIMRLTAGGLADPSFGMNGLVEIPNCTAGTPCLGSIRAVAVFDDGRIVAATTAGFPASGQALMSAFRLSAAGVRDDSFGEQGLFRTQTDFTNVLAQGGAFAIARVDANRVVVAGALKTNFALLRLLGDAPPDFDGDGILDPIEAIEGRNPIVKDNDVFSPGAASARLFAMQMYRDFLGREGDAAGIQGWTDAVTNGTYSRAQVIDAFLSSQEFSGFVAPVVRLYFATFLRVPDYEGLAFNAGLVRAGTITVVQLADFFTQSPEFIAAYGALDNPQFVTLLYNNVLGRAPDQAGLDGWVALLQSGYTRGQVLLGFSESTEYQAAIANEVFVTMMYAGMLRRTPEPNGFSGWVNLIETGTPRENVINGFFLSTEYRARFLP